jgi:hypothetical protein
MVYLWNMENSFGISCRPENTEFGIMLCVVSYLSLPRGVFPERAPLKLPSIWHHIKVKVKSSL